MEMRGIEPRAFHMQSERSTTELHPLLLLAPLLPSDSVPIEFNKIENSKFKKILIIQ